MLHKIILDDIDSYIELNSRNPIITVGEMTYYRIVSEFGKLELSEIKPRYFEPFSYLGQLYGCDIYGINFDFFYRLSGLPPVKE